jgi:putative intracellular protease/amidase
MIKYLWVQPTNKIRSIWLYEKSSHCLPSHDQLGNTGKKTGFWLEEFTSPYYEFIDNGYEVTIASPKGWKPPLDLKSTQKGNQTESTRRFEKDKSAQTKIENTVVLSQVSASDFDTLFLPGGHGPMWDLSTDKNMKKLAEDFYAGEKIVSAVCHGPAGLLQATIKMETQYRRVKK